MTESKGGWERLCGRVLVAFRMLTRPVAKVRGIRLRVSRAVSMEMRLAIYTDHYVFPEIALVDAYLERGDRVMELGGGLGVLSAFCARRVGSSNVVTYEGNPALEKRALETYRLNGVNPRFVPGLIGQEAGEQTFYVAKSTWSSSTLPHPWRRTTPVRLPVRSFDAELQEFDPTFVVMDIEGGEYDLLTRVDWRNVRKLVVEHHPQVLGEEKVEEVRERLREFGFVTREAIGRVEYLTRSRSA
jgi:FkbM family methyltransferase